ncbi:MAG: hypothetical protein NVS4B1_19760 [Ktedonobacteraceae bacterium]
MERRPYRSILLQIGLLLLIIFLVVWAPGRLNPASRGSVATPGPTQADQGSAAIPAPTKTAKRPIATPGPTQTVTGTNPAFALTGASVWILSCLDGWEKQQIYQANPYYINDQGVKKARDIYVFGSFWVQPDTGALMSSMNSPETFRCLSNLLTTVHSQYHAHVCGVLSVKETSGGWKPADVISYTKRAVANSSLLTPIVDQAKQYPYDCLINDIEDGDSAHPEIFSYYEALLRGKLSIPLGQTLLWKTLAVSTYWQKWQDWGALANNADFFIIMALDHDSINNTPIPSSIVDYSWLKELYTYMRSVPNLFGTHPVAWELPTYYRLFTHQQNGTWAVSSGTDVETQIAVAVKSNAILKNSGQDAKDPYLEYAQTPDQMTYLFFETGRSSDVLAQTLTGLNASACIMVSFWDNDSGTSNSLGWSSILPDRNVHLC